MTTDDVSKEDPGEGPSEQDELDEIDEESFPASDPPSSWAGPSSESSQ